MSTSAAAQPDSPLTVYYCLCGEFALVVDRPLSALPTRPLDRAHVLRCLDAASPSASASDPGRKARVFKISALQAPPKLVQHPDARAEKRFPFICTRCRLEIGYEHTPPPIKSGGTFTFILPGALT